MIRRLLQLYLIPWGISIPILPMSIYYRWPAPATAIAAFVFLTGCLVYWPAQWWGSRR